MAVLIDKNTRLIVQGITGREGTFHAKQAQAYGTNVVGGVTPGKGGQMAVDGRVPGFNTVAEAVRETGANTQVILNTLYKNTQMQETFGIIMLALVGRQPKVLNLKEVLHQFVLFRREIVTRRTEFDLKKAREREHVLEGLRIALDQGCDHARLRRGADEDEHGRARDLA